MISFTSLYVNRKCFRCVRQQSYSDQSDAFQPDSSSSRFHQDHVVIDRQIHSGIDDFLGNSPGTSSQHKSENRTFFSKFSNFMEKNQIQSQDFVFLEERLLPCEEYILKTFSYNFIRLFVIEQCLLASLRQFSQLLNLLNS